MFVVCEKWVETRTDCYIDPSSSFDHSSTFSSSWLGCSTVGHWGPQSPHSASCFSRWHPVSNWLKPSGHLVILFSNVHLLPLFFHLFTQVNLLIDGSVEGQYITRFVYSCFDMIGPCGVVLYCYNDNYYCFTSCEIFTPANVGSLSVEIEWHQVSFGLQDFSEYFSRS